MWKLERGTEKAAWTGQVLCMGKRERIKGEVGGRRSEDGGQRTEDRGRKSEDGGRRTEKRRTLNIERPTLKDGSRHGPVGWFGREHGHACGCYGSAPDSGRAGPSARLFSRLQIGVNDPQKEGGTDTIASGIHRRLRCRFLPGSAQLQFPVALHALWVLILLP
jgi:hypothetical protein